MTLSARVGRMEARVGFRGCHIQIVAQDEADADRQIEDAILAAGPGRLTLAVTIGGRSTEKTMNILSHDERLEQLR